MTHESMTGPITPTMSPLGAPSPSSASSPEWRSRGYLPHRDRPGLLQSITYRLADSLPTEALAQIEEELRLTKPADRDAERRRRQESWLDSGHGYCILRDPRAAACVVDTWRRFARERYDLIAWVVMPNHVHVLIRVYAGFSLATIVQSWKSYTGRRIAPWLREEIDQQPTTHPPCAVWMREYWDRFVRDNKHFVAIIDYIHQNPVKAGLVRQAKDWRWSSAKEYEDAELGLGAPRDGKI